MSTQIALALRQNEIDTWLTQVLKTSSFDLVSASSDASFRRYFRVSLDEKTWILMDAPPEKENTAPFIKMATFLFSQGINAPQIYAKDSQLGFLLLTDFGAIPYLEKLNNSSVIPLYSSAIDALIQMQLSDISQLEIPQYNAYLLQQELSLFPVWFLQKHLNIAVPDWLTNIDDLLIQSALEQPTSFVHRDYHSRNLMYIENEEMGIIDFQDAVVGPLSYDLVSLLRDCYIEWPDEVITQCIEYYFTQATQHGLLNNIPIEQFTKWFDFMGLQRHIKILGIFCRLNYRDNKSNYINDLPLTLKYVKKISAKYPELAKLSLFLQQQPEIAAIHS